MPFLSPGRIPGRPDIGAAAHSPACVLSCSSSRRRGNLPGRVALALLALVVVGSFLAGCARVPAQPPAALVRRRLAVDFQVAGRINPLYYYFVAIDTAGDPSAGPVPVVSSPWGNGWGTGRITHFIQYHLGVFTVYRFRPDSNLLIADPIGTPFEFNRPEDPPGNRIRAVLDVDTTLGAEASLINLNVITTDRIDIEPAFQGTKLYDGLGSTGNHFLTIPVFISQVFTNAQSADLEEAGDLPPQPSPDVEANDLDITDWTVDVRVLQ